MRRALLALLVAGCLLLAGVEAANRDARSKRADQHAVEHAKADADADASATDSADTMQELQQEAKDKRELGPEADSVEEDASKAKEAQAPTGATPQVMQTKTATGDPVVSANKNEIMTVKEDTEAEADDEGAEAEKELEETKKIERQKRKERRDKRADEALFKNREEQKKEEERQRRGDKFEQKLKKQTEESKKHNNEEEKKANSEFDRNEKKELLREKVEMGNIRRKYGVKKAGLDAQKKEWEMKVDLKEKQYDEQKYKAHEQIQKSKDEQEKKEQKAEADKKKKAERETKKEEDNKRREKVAKKRQEVVNKKNAEARDKAQRQAESQAKERAQEQGVKNTEKRQKDARLAQERNTKQAERNAKAERAAKERNQKAERSAKERNQKNQPATWCHCHYRHDQWNGYNRWYNCPGHTLLVGIHRRHWHYTNAISHYRCCHACRGSQRLSLRCSTANWVHSFDRKGWSWCPHSGSTGTYIQGFYKSSCNWIYCIEYARCCHINGSRGRLHCGTANWWHSFDRAGWSWLAHHRWMMGLYRTSGQHLYNIEYAYQCMAYAY